MVLLPPWFKLCVSYYICTLSLLHDAYQFTHYSIGGAAAHYVFCGYGNSFHQC